MDYSKTVNLPDTPFAMKAGLSQKEPAMVKRWDAMKLYERQLEIREGCPDYILHDGPPYANGEIHIGHALNKTLKDLILKYRFFKGFRVPYVPGWDCHGLPIELKVTEEIGPEAKTMHPLKVREKCRKYADKFVKLQREGFKRMGVFGNWGDPYLTMSKDYEETIVETFAELFRKGHIYRGLRPVLWCPHCETALAEAEIEYKDHVSPAITVRFPIAKHSVKGMDGKASVLIWTTTPWTLPANTGLSFNPDETYVAVQVPTGHPASVTLSSSKGDNEGRPSGHGSTGLTMTHDGREWLVMAKELRDAALALNDLKAVKEIELTRADIDSLDVRHIWIDRPSKVVFGSHVTMDTGTGVVHTAPGHGMDDYLVGKEYGLEMLSPVDDEGRFTAEVPEWKGMKVAEANPKIIEFLKERGALYARGDINHSYPHCWRCKGPVIFRSKPQWFFKVSDAKLAGQTLAELPGIEWVPEWGQDRIRNMLDGRPDWCLSRQRKWGVPIPAFYCEDCGETVMNDATLGSVIEIVRAEGIDVWYKKEAAELLPANYKCPKCGGSHFTKGADILDVWFDSGVSAFAVIDKRPELRRPADVYLEGNDQYRGWFQSSIWPSVALTGKAPYKTIITHGMVMDKDNVPMHKSAGNAIAPREVWDVYGADVLRIWCVIEDFTKDPRLDQALIQKCVDAYRKIRNTFKYLLGNLKGFDASMKLPYAELKDVDRYALSLLSGLYFKVDKAFEHFDFQKAFREIHNFCVVDMSARYLDLLKDRLYVSAPDSKDRRSAQTVLYELLETLMLLLAPVIPYTMEEVFMTCFAKGDDDSVHLQKWKTPPAEWNNETLRAKFDKLMEVRDTALKALDELRTAGTIGNSLEAKVVVKTSDAEFEKLLKEYEPELRYYFIVSDAKVGEFTGKPTASDGKVDVWAMTADGAKCARCWNYSVHVGEDKDHPELCERCAPVVRSLPQE